MTVCKKFIISGLLAATALSFTPEAAHAEAGDWLVRARMIAAAPDESSVVSIGGSAEVTTAYVPEVDFSYFLTDKVALELILATTPHDVRAENTALGDLDLGSLMLLPPTLSLQYHPLAGETFSPYLGVGVNLSLFYSEEAPATGPVVNVDYDTAVGLSLQAGVDYALTDKWFINLDVKRLFLSTDVSINDGAVTADVDLDPWIFGAGFGFRF